MCFTAVLGAAFMASAAQPTFAGQVETKGKAKIRGEKSLYERLGGKKAISAVVDEFVANCAADARINKFFAATAADPNRLASFKGKLVDQICQAGGGPCSYTGKSLKEAHAGIGLSTPA